MKFGLLKPSNGEYVYQLTVALDTNPENTYYDAITENCPIYYGTNSSFSIETNGQVRSKGYPGYTSNENVIIRDKNGNAITAGRFVNGLFVEWSDL